MQRHATKLQPVEQLSFEATRVVESRPVNFDRIYQLTSVAEAIDYGCELARLVPKQVYTDMGREKTVWSRIVNGDIELPARDVHKFDVTVRNQALLLYLNHCEGIDLHSIRFAQDDKDRRIAELESELERERADKATIAKFIRETMR